MIAEYTIYDHSELVRIVKLDNYSTKIERPDGTIDDVDTDKLVLLSPEAIILRLQKRIIELEQVREYRGDED